jgi:hypothetical protein
MRVQEIVHCTTGEIYSQITSYDHQPKKKTRSGVKKCDQYVRRGLRLVKWQMNDRRRHGTNSTRPSSPTQEWLLSTDVNLSWLKGLRKISPLRSSVPSWLVLGDFQRFWKDWVPHDWRRSGWSKIENPGMTCLVGTDPPRCWDTSAQWTSEQCICTPSVLQLPFSFTQVYDPWWARTDHGDSVRLGTNSST